MKQAKRILVFQFHQESNTFNPKVESFDRFHPRKVFEGLECFDNSVRTKGLLAGAVDAIRQAGGEVIPAVFMRAPSGGRVDSAVMDYLRQKLKDYIETVGEIDGIFASLHGATSAVGCDDACGALLEYLRGLVGEKVIAGGFDLHANITEKVLRNTDIICGYQTYPHVDHYQTGYRAGKLTMELLAGKTRHMAAATLAMLVPPAGFTDLCDPFKALMEKGRNMVSAGDILDFTVFPVQPWLDIENIQSCVVTIGEDPEKAKHCADVLAAELFAHRDEMQPPLLSVDEIIDIAENNKTNMPVILADAADSPNGGAVGDSPVVAMRLQERGSTLRACMFVVDPDAVEMAFRLGVGAKAAFSVGAGFTKGMPGPFRAEGTVRSLHDGYFRTGKHATSWLGPAAVVSFGNVDILLCNHGAATGDPMIFRGFGLEPAHYDLVVVKANTSFRVPYARISELMYVADTPGAGAPNLRSAKWENLPNGLYPFDLPEDYKPEKAKLW